MKNIFTFQNMWATNLITVIYWIILLGVLIVGLAVIVSGNQDRSAAVNFIAGIITIVVGTIGARFWCEMFIVIFRIHDNLKIIADKVGSESTFPPSPPAA